MSDLDGARPSREEAEEFWSKAQGGGGNEKGAEDPAKIAEQALAQMLGADWEEKAEPDEILAMIQLAQSVAKGKDVAGTVAAIQTALKSM